MAKGRQPGDGVPTALRQYSERSVPEQFPTVPQADPPAFKHAQFPGYVSGVKMGSRGDIQFMITVPSRWIHLAMDMFFATRKPLSIDIQHWDLADE